MSYDAQRHWENIYQAKNSPEVSWYQKKPQTSLQLIAELGLDKQTAIIDIGAGDSMLVDNLLAIGYKDITLLDVSSAALERSRRRLANSSSSSSNSNSSGEVKWVVSDLRKFETSDRYDLWHDRAMFHFLTAEEDIKKYVDSVNRLVKPSGYLILAAFSVKGPRKCSGLEVRPYSENSLRDLFGDWESLRIFEEEHITPAGARQIFIYSLFRKKGGKTNE